MISPLIAFLALFSFGRAAQPTPDDPVPFGYKNQWLAVKSDDPQKVIEALSLRKVKPSSWAKGVEQGYERGIFITPSIDGWVLVLGMALYVGDAALRSNLADLSKQFGECHYFYTHRVVEAHVWMRAVEGQIVRAYSYVGESGEVDFDEGKPQGVEATWKFFDPNSQEAEDDAYWDREDLTWPDEESVMQIAGDWSVNPTLLQGRTDLPGTGWIAK